MFIINLVLALRRNTGAAQPPVRRPILALSNGDMTYGGCCTRRSARLGIGCPASVMVFLALRLGLFADEPARCLAIWRERRDQKDGT